MRRGRILPVFLLVLSLIMGTQVYAQESSEAGKAEVSMAMSGTSSDGTVSAGDALQFRLTVSNPGGAENLGGAVLRFQVSETEDMSGRLGNPVMSSESAYLTDPNQANGLSTIRVGAGLSGEAEAAVALQITEEMAGKTLYFQADLRPDLPGEPAFAQTPVTSVRVTAQEEQEPGETDPEKPGQGEQEPGEPEPEPVTAMEVSASVHTDLTKIEKGKEFSGDITVSNTGNTAVEYIYVTAGYSAGGIESDAENMMPIGRFVSLPDGVTQPEDGVACIVSLPAGESVTLPASAEVPESFAGEEIVLTFMAVSYGSEDFSETDTPVVLEVTELSGKIAAEASEPGTGGSGSEDPAPGTGDGGNETPGADPGKPVITDPKDPSEQKPADNPKPDDTKKTMDAKTEKAGAAPRTGDPASAALAVMAMLGAAAVGAAAGKKQLFK